MRDFQHNKRKVENSTENSQKTDKPWLWKKGQSGNPGGRPKGSLKDYVKRKLAEMSEEEKEQFLREVPKDLQWRMSEGNPSTTHEGGDKPIKVQIIPGELIDKNEIQVSSEPEPNSEGQDEV